MRCRVVRSSLESAWDCISRVKGGCMARALEEEAQGKREQAGAVGEYHVDYP